MIITVCGHRPDKLGGYNYEDNPVFLAVMEALDKKLVEIQPELVYTGMALGVDQWAAELCTHNDIPYIAAIPFVGFESKWPPKAQEIYKKLCKDAKTIHHVSTSDVYHPSHMQVRNEYMVDRSDLVLAVWDGSSGGTANCIKYAKKKGKEVVMVKLSPDILTKAKQAYAADKAKKLEKAKFNSPIGQAKNKFLTTIDDAPPLATKPSPMMVQHISKKPTGTVPLNYAEFEKKFQAVHKDMALAAIEHNEKMIQAQKAYAAEAQKINFDVLLTVDTETLQAQQKDAIIQELTYKIKQLETQLYYSNAVKQLLPADGSYLLTGVEYEEGSVSKKTKKEKNGKKEDAMKPKRLLDLDDD